MARARSLKHARQAGIEASGIDVNPDAVAQARIEGLPVQSLDLQTVAREHAGQFDAVCSFQVLEHTADPGEFPGTASAAEAGRDADRLGAQFRGIPQVPRTNYSISRRTT